MKLSTLNALIEGKPVNPDNCAPKEYEALKEAGVRFEHERDDKKNEATEAKNVANVETLDDKLAKFNNNIERIMPNLICYPCYKPKNDIYGVVLNIRSAESKKLNPIDVSSLINHFKYYYDFSGNNPWTNYYLHPDTDFDGIINYLINPTGDGVVIYANDEYIFGPQSDSEDLIFFRHWLSNLLGALGECFNINLMIPSSCTFINKQSLMTI